MRIKMLAMDVDGTLTDGRIYIGARGELMKAFDVKDGHGIVEFRKGGGIPVIITGRQSDIAAVRAKELGITEVYQSVSDKLSCLKEIAQKYGLSQEEIAYIGDDVNDLACMNYCGVSACPADAVSEVKAAAGYICRAAGGRGAVREFLDRIASDDSEPFE